MPIKSNLTHILSAAISIAVLIGMSGEAMSKDRRAHSSICHSPDTPEVINNVRIKNNSVHSQRIYCPVATDSYLAHHKVRGLNVHGYEGSSARSGVSSRACVKHYNNNSYVCGATKSWGAGYFGGRGVDISRWTSFSASFPYIYTSLGAGDEFYGFYYHD